MSSNRHDIRFEVWGRYAVLICRSPNCYGMDGPNTDQWLMKADGNHGIPLVEAVAAIEKHTGEGAFRIAVAGGRVEGRVEFGQQAEEPLVARGPVDDYRAPGVSRTGQVYAEGVEETLRKRTDGGPSLNEYLRSKGEL